MRARIAFAVLGACACGNAAAEPPPRSADVTLTTAAADTPAPVERGVTWAGETKSRWPLDREHEMDAREAALTSACGIADGALDRVAREVADVRARGLGAPDADDVEALLRVAGSPFPRARVVTAAGRAPLDDDALAKKLGSAKKALTRCAVVLARTAHGGEIAVAIAVDGYAELAPLPMRARTGEWLTLDATVGVPASDAKLVVLGPRGAPRTVPTSLDSNGRVRARFALDRPGGFRVQLVADVGSGPRPLLEARIFADVMPPASLDAEPAPGEEASTGNDDAALARMVAALRKSEALRPLTRDPELDALARAHAEHMRDDAKLAHDVGDGDLRARFEQRGLFAKAVGENVAHAATVQRAHRALHASPSHRINLLRADYTHLGVGVAQADDGTVYVCEVFAARP